MRNWGELAPVEPLAVEGCLEKRGSWSCSGSGAYVGGLGEGRGFASFSLGVGIGMCFVVRML